MLLGKSSSTSLRWRHNERNGICKSPASRWLAQSFVQAQIKGNIRVPRGMHHWLVNSPQKGPVTRKMFLFDDVILMSVPSIYDHRFKFTFFIDQNVIKQMKIRSISFACFTSCNSVLTTLLTVSQLCDEPMTMSRALWTHVDDFMTILKQLMVWRVCDDPNFEICHKTTLKSS